MFCTNCGKEVPNDCEFCDQCGALIKTPGDQNINKSDDSKSIPEKYYDENAKTLAKYSKPMSTTAFFFTQILFTIPIINLFFIIYWSFKKNINANLKSYSRSMLIWAFISTLIFIFIILTMAFMQCSISFHSFLRLLKNYLNKIA